MTDNPEDTMTPRDWFAAAALQGLLAKSVAGLDTPEAIAADAYLCADAMMKQRQGVDAQESQDDE